MNLTLVDRIANAVLYEGYMLYPYRASAVKNRQRWNFGAVYPEIFCAASGGTDSCVMQTQCLVAGNDRASVDVKVRFLHLIAREVAAVENGASRIGNSKDSNSNLSSMLDPQSSIFRPVESLEVNGQLYQTWQEAVEREVSANGLELDDLGYSPARIFFGCPANHEEENLRDAVGEIAGVGSSRVDLQACKLEYSIVSPK